MAIPNLNYFVFLAGSAMFLVKSTNLWSMRVVKDSEKELLQS